MGPRTMEGGGMRNRSLWVLTRGRRIRPRTDRSWSAGSESRRCNPRPDRRRGCRPLAGRQRGDVVDGPAQLLAHRPWSVLGKGVDESLVVPDDLRPLGVETVPQRVADCAKVEQNRPCVVELVGEGDAERPW